MKKESPIQAKARKLPWPNFYQIIGTVLIVAAFFLTDFHFAFPLAALVWGAMIIALDLYLRHRAGREKRELQALKSELESEAARYRYKSRLLDTLMREGLPEGVELPQLDAYLDQVTDASSEESEQLDLEALAERQKVKKR